MIQVICSKCKGAGKVPCPVCAKDEDDVSERLDVCPSCGNTGFIVCTGCMGGGIIDTNAMA